MVDQKRLALEKKTSAITLSDMEIFIFPELMIAGALANLMSPIVWEWRNDPYFKDMDRLSQYQRILKVKQYIIDHFVFNLDLETWGLTTKERERRRFQQFVNFKDVEESNALMGYEGDHYYYDIDIRSHFGLDKYTTNVIPYWKTETVEAMTAFANRPNFSTGAGECVSLAMLYFAALHIVAKVPLDKMYMMATPLHSQNFIDVEGGIITNNRRIVTKNMWNNGTLLSAKARRALLNEKVTIVANLNGYVHTMYDTATMPKSEYAKFKTSITDYLKADVTTELFYSFLRHEAKWQKLFCFETKIKGQPCYVEAEALYAVEQSVDLRITTSSSIGKLIQKSGVKVSESPIEGRITLMDVNNHIQALHKEDREHWCNVMSEWFQTLDENVVSEMAAEFASFSFIEPRLPRENKIQVSSVDLNALEQCNSAQEVIDLLKPLRPQSELVELAFTAFRDIDDSSWEPFLMAALERNPVCIAETEDMDDDEVYSLLKSFSDESIYSGNRLAQPDEVYNFRTGDGAEKAICMWDILRSRYPYGCGEIKNIGDDIILEFEDRKYCFKTQKVFSNKTIKYRCESLQDDSKSMWKIHQVC